MAGGHSKTPTSYRKRFIRPKGQMVIIYDALRQKRLTVMPQCVKLQIAARRHECEDAMSRVIKRYGSRKLYDTQESRYVSLEQISDWIREGQEISVIDNATSDEVTAQTLTQVISELGRKKNAFLSSDLLHDLIRKGENAVSSGVKQIQKSMDVLVERSIGRLNPVKDIKEEMNLLKKRLSELESSLEGIEEGKKN